MSAAVVFAAMGEAVRGDGGKTIQRKFKVRNDGAVKNGEMSLRNIHG